MVITADRDNVQLSPREVRMDVDDLSYEDLDPILKHESLEFLPGYSPGLSEPLRDWVDAARDQVHITITGHLVSVLNTARRRGDWDLCEKLASHCRRLDPFNETAVLAHAEVTAIRGGKREAVAMLDRYINEVGSTNPDLKISATILRKRVNERFPELDEHRAQESTFVGRETEMELLNLRLAAARSGAGGAHLLTGEAGIGKSRLASEVAKVAELDGVITERAMCRQADIDRPLSVFVDLMPRLRELPGALGCSQETLSTLKRLTEFDTSAIDPTSLPDATDAYAKMQSAVLDIFDAIVDEQCVLVILDDVQWLDRASTKLLAAIIPWAKTRRLLFLFNQRPESGPVPNNISDIELPTLPIGALSATAAKMLLSSVITQEIGAAGGDLVARLLAVGEGNPFFLQELGKQWLETGKEQEFPPSVAAVVHERLSRLSLEALQTLQACAVLGINATLERVESLLEYKPYRLLAAIQELSTTGMLHAEESEATDLSERLSVRHDLLSTAALRRLAKAPLAFLHRRAGLVLERETLKAGTSTSLLWACAFHWRHAGDRERAFGAARSCAEHLLELGLILDSAHAFERTLEYCVNDTQRLLTLSRLAVARQMNGDWQQSKKVLQRFRQIRSGTAPNATIHDDAEFALYDATWRASLDNMTLLSDLIVCATCKEAPPRHRVACGLLGLKVASNLNELAPMGDLYRNLVGLFEAAETPPRVRYEIEMVFHSACGDVDKVATAAKLFVDAVRGTTDSFTFSRAVANAAIAYRLAGCKADAEALFQEAFDHAVTNGLMSRATLTCYSLVRLYLAEGDIAQARNALNRAEGIAGFGEDIHLIADRHYLYSRVSLEEGNIKDAESHYDITVAEMIPNQSINRRTSVVSLGIRLAIAKALPAASYQPLVAELENLHLSNRASGWQDFEAHALYVGLKGCGEVAKARRLLTDYVSTYRREKWPVPRSLNELLA